MAPTGLSCLVRTIRGALSVGLGAGEPPHGAMRVALSVTVALLGAQQTAGHGATSFPKPRNAIDHELPPWNGAVPTTRTGGAPFTGWCPIPSNTSKGELSGASTGRSPSSPPLQLLAVGPVFNV